MRITFLEVARWTTNISPLSRFLKEHLSYETVELPVAPPGMESTLQFGAGRQQCYFSLDGRGGGEV